MSKIVVTHLTIDAVWATLTDLDRFHTWNPFITSAAGTLSVGERLTLTIQPPGRRPMEFSPTVTAVEDPHYVEWIGHLGFPGVFDGRHSFTLTPTASGHTLLQQSETFTGALVGFTGSMLAHTRSGFIAMNDALAAEASQRLDEPADVATLPEGHR